MKDLAASGMTMVVVTHELGFARQVADRVAFMENGKLEEYGSAEQVLVNPSNPRTLRFIQAVNS